MPRGRPKKQPEERARGNGKGLNKTEAVHRALDQLGTNAKPLAIQELIKAEFGIDMPTNMISNYKSTLKKAGALSTITRKRRGPATAARAPRAAGPGAFTAEDVRAVKELADRIGADGVRELAKALSP